MKNITITTLFLLSMAPVFCLANDSLKIVALENSVSLIKRAQSVEKKELGADFEKLKTSLEDDHQFLKLLAWTGIGGSIVALLTLFVGAKKYVEKKINNKFDKIITEKEGDILALIDQQSKEKQFVKNKKILVLTASPGDDVFLRKFFKAMGFPIDNVNYTKISEYEKPDGKYDLIFANNEKGDLSKDITDAYFENSSNDTVLFYFNSTRKNYNSTTVEDRLSFANAKTQIYGNLINLFKFQKTL